MRKYYWKMDIIAVLLWLSGVGFRFLGNDTLSWVVILAPIFSIWGFCLYWRSKRT